jgi:cytochrome c-type biogenesis protein CcmH
LIEQAGGSAAAPVAATSAGITVRVEIAPELAADIPADATVFITARAPNGPPMPLAVIKRAASELPFEVVLDDTLAMSPQHRLSQHESVDLTARISRSGRAERESGDWIAELRSVTVGGVGTQTMTINAQLP